MSILATGQQIGRYVIIVKVGQSQAVVYKASDPVFNRIVAIKDLSPMLGVGTSADEKADILARFDRELKTMGQLVHPNIMQVYDAGFFTVAGDPTNTERPYIVMEYLEGDLLRDKMPPHSIFPLQQATDILSQLLSALAKAHELSIVHRDIKPDNIQLLPDGTIKLMDFGLAMMIGQTRLSKSGDYHGTPNYSSPEQVTGAPIDHGQTSLPWALLPSKCLQEPNLSMLRTPSLSCTRLRILSQHSRPISHHQCSRFFNGHYRNHRF
jgi:serine/threonine protein kinase